MTVYDFLDKNFFENRGKIYCDTLEEQHQVVDILEHNFGFVMHPISKEKLAYATEIKPWNAVGFAGNDDRTISRYSSAFNPTFDLRACDFLAMVGVRAEEDFQGDLSELYGMEAGNGH